MLLKGTGGIEGAELPLIHVIRKFGPVYQGVYGIVIVTAIYTSAIAAGHGFLENCSKNKKNIELLVYAYVYLPYLHQK